MLKDENMRRGVSAAILPLIVVAIVLVLTFALYTYLSTVMSVAAAPRIVATVTEYTISNTSLSIKASLRNEGSSTAQLEAIYIGIENSTGSYLWIEFEYDASSRSWKSVEVLENGASSTRSASLVVEIGGRVAEEPIDIGSGMSIDMVLNISIDDLQSFASSTQSISRITAVFVFNNDFAIAEKR